MLETRIRRVTSDYGKHFIMSFVMFWEYLSTEKVSDFSVLGNWLN